MELFGPYWLLKRLAVGGMAELFLAKSQDEPRAGPLVLKRILPELLERPDIVEMFLDEVRLNSLLHHPNIVEVRDLGEEDGLQYIVLEYVHGMTLSRLLRCVKGPLPVALACWIVAEACAGLGHAHRRTVTYSGQPLGIVHRDINPQNILVSFGGEVKLADFGVAKTNMRLTKSDPGQVKGKWAYMSPEQCMEDEVVDHRSDIFSVGAVLYESTTGQRLFKATLPQEILTAILTLRFTPPEQVVPDYPPALATIVDRTLRLSPNDRYQDAGEMRDDLLALLPDRDLAGELASLVQDCGSRSAGPSDEQPDEETSAATRH